MTTIERAQMLQRFEDADRWLARVYDPRRSEEHRAAIWNFVATFPNRRFRNIITAFREMDESVVRFWDNNGRN